MSNKQRKNQQDPIDKSNKFDKIIKENMVECTLPFIDNLFNLNIQPNDMIDVDPQIQTTMKREVDFLKKIKGHHGAEDYLLQIEFQTKNETRMNARMGEYYGILYTKYDLTVKQYVIYIGDEPMTMVNYTRHENFEHRFEIINIRDKNYLEFVKSDIPEFVILGILAGFGQDKPETAVRNILQQIITITDTNQRYKNTIEQQKYLRQIDVMSQLRGLQNTITQILKNMDITFDITKDLRYQEGELVGGIKGKAEEKNNNILKGHSKGMTIVELADFFDVSIEYVKKVIKSK